MTPARLREIQSALVGTENLDTFVARKGGDVPEVGELISALRSAWTTGRIECRWGCDTGVHASGCPLKYPGNYSSKEALDKALEIVIHNLHREREKR